MKKLFTLAVLFFSLTLVASGISPKSKWASFDNNKIHFKTVGKGKKALVFVHGWTCSAEFWRKSVSAFPGYRVIAVDLPGHGKSDKPKTDYTIEYFAKSVHAVIKEAGVKQAVLIGHSMGTPIIRQFYRLYPEKTRGLVVVDGAMRSFGTKEEAEAFVAPLKANYKENSVNFIDGMLGPVKDPELKQEIRRVMVSTPEHVGLSAMYGMIDETIWKKDKISVPVLVILAKSPWWRPDEEDYVRSIAPDLKFQMWEGVSHFLMMEQPKRFNAEIRKFIAENKLL